MKSTINNALYALHHGSSVTTTYKDIEFTIFACETDIHYYVNTGWYGRKKDFATCKDLIKPFTISYDHWEEEELWSLKGILTKEKLIQFLDQTGFLDIDM